MTNKIGNAAIIFIFCFVSACNSDVRPSAPITNAEQAARETIRQEVISAFLQQDFARLEAMAEQYRRSKSRTPSGLWTLGRFYAAFGSLYPQGTPPEVWLEASKATLSWAEKFPESPTPRIAHAAILSKYAWEIRGYREAGAVQEETWAPFHENQSSARAYLEQHKSIAAADPHWYALMLSILKTESADDETIKQYYLEGVSREPLYLPTHMEALYNFIPKWGGSAQEVDDFILLATRQVEKPQRDMLYARLYWASASNQYHDKDFFRETRADWPRMRRGMKAVVGEYPDVWNIFHFTNFACYAGDKKTTGEYMSLLQEHEADSWFENYTDYKLCKEWVFNGGPDIDRAQAMFYQKMAEEDLLQQQRLRRMEVNLRYKEQMLPEYAKRLQELQEKSRNTKVASMEEARAGGDELMKLHDMIHELKNRDVFTDWGLDYGETGPGSAPAGTEENQPAR